MATEATATETSRLVNIVAGKGIAWLVAEGGTISRAVLAGEEKNCHIASETPIAITPAKNKGC